GDEGGQSCIRPRDGEDEDAGGDGGRGDLGARIGDAGRAGVGDDGNARAGFQFRDELLGASSFVVLVVADGGRRDLEMVEELLRLAGVLAGDAVAGAQHTQGAQRYVFEIADGRGDELEAGGEGIVWLIVVRHTSSIIPYSSQGDRAGLQP